MTQNDLLLLTILAIGVCWINWNVIKRDLSPHDSTFPSHHSNRNTEQSSANEKKVQKEHLP